MNFEFRSDNHCSVTLHQDYYNHPYLFLCLSTALCLVFGHGVPVTAAVQMIVFEQPMSLAIGALTWRAGGGGKV